MIMDLAAPRPRPEPTERTVEYAFALEQLPLLNGRDLLDVGHGPNPALWYMLCTMGYRCLGIDLKPRCDHPDSIVKDITKYDDQEALYNGVFCISTLEHITDYITAVENMARLTRSGGLVVLTFPYSKEYIANTTPGHYTQSFSMKEVRQMCGIIGQPLRTVYWKGYTGKQWADGERVVCPQVVNESQADLIGLAVRQ